MEILIVEDHLMSIDGYITRLKASFPTANCLQALTSQEAYRLITTSPKLDWAIIDQQLPAYEEKNLFSGIDIALLIKERHPACKIIIITAHEEAIELYKIYYEAKPDALLIKSEFSNFNFLNLLAPNKTYQSPKVKKAIRSLIKSELLTDFINIEILGYLKESYKASELHEHIDLSQSAIDKRIKKMREYFDASDTVELIRKASQEKII